MSKDEKSKFLDCSPEESGFIKKFIQGDTVEEKKFDNSTQTSPERLPKSPPVPPRKPDSSAFIGLPTKPAPPIPSQKPSIPVKSAPPPPPKRNYDADDEFVEDFDLEENEYLLDNDDEQDTLDEILELENNTIPKKNKPPPPPSKPRVPSQKPFSKKPQLSLEIPECEPMVDENDSAPTSPVPSTDSSGVSDNEDNNYKMIEKLKKNFDPTDRPVSIHPADLFRMMKEQKLSLGDEKKEEDVVDVDEEKNQSDAGPKIPPKIPPSLRNIYKKEVALVRDSFLEALSSDEEDNDSDDEDTKELRLKLLTGGRKTRTRRREIHERSFLHSVQKLFPIGSDFTEFKTFCYYIQATPPRDDDSWVSLIKYLYDHLRGTEALVKNFIIFVDESSHKKYLSLAKKLFKREHEREKRIQEMRMEGVPKAGSRMSEVLEEEKIKEEERLWKLQGESKKREEKKRKKMERKKEMIEIQVYREKQREKNEDLKRKKMEERKKREGELRIKREEEIEEKRRHKAEEKRKKEEKLNQKREEDEIERKRIAEEKRKNRSEEERLKFLKDQEQLLSKLITFVRKDQLPKIIDLCEDNEDTFDINQFYEGLTPLHWASYFGHRKIVKYFLNYPGIIFNPVTKIYPPQSLTEDNEESKKPRKGKMTPFLISAQRNHFKIIELFLGFPEVEVTTKNEKGKSAVDLTKNKKIRELVIEELGEIQSRLKLFDERIKFIRERYSNVEICVSETNDPSKKSVLKENQFFLCRTEHFGSQIGLRIEEDDEYVTKACLNFLYGLDLKIKKKNLYDAFLVAKTWNLQPMMHQICLKILEKVEIDTVLKIVRRTINSNHELGESVFEKALVKKLQIKYLPELSISTENQSDPELSKIIKKLVRGDYATENLLDHLDLRTMSENNEQFLSSRQILDKFIDSCSDSENTNMSLVSNGGQKVEVHREILILRVDYIYEILKSNPNLKEITLDVFSYDELRAFVQWVCRKECKEKGVSMLWKCFSFKISHQMKNDAMKMIKKKFPRKNGIELVLKHGYLLMSEENKEFLRKLKKYLARDYSMSFVNQLFEQSKAFNEKIVSLKKKQ